MTISTRSLNERDLTDNQELQAVASNAVRRQAVWNTLAVLGYTADQIEFSEHAKGKHTSNCTQVGDAWDCSSEGDVSNHPILDKYNEVETILGASGLLDVGRTITDETELAALPAGSIIRCVKDRANPDWPEIFLNTGFGNGPWLLMDPSDRDDGEYGMEAGAVLRWHGDGKAMVLHIGSGQ